MTKLVFLNLVCLLQASVCRAGDWTVDGKTYQNVRVVSHDSTIVTVSYNNSRAPTAPSDLSKAIQQGIIGTVTLPIASLAGDIQHVVLTDHTTVLNAVMPDSNAPEYVMTLSDLCSQSPNVRSKAAELIRDHHLYKSTSRDPWDKWAVGLTKGESFPEVIDYLHTRGIGLALPANYSPSNRGSEMGSDPR